MQKQLNFNGPSHRGSAQQPRWITPETKNAVYAQSVQARFSYTAQYVQHNQLLITGFTCTKVQTII